jgi:hypothetical protein
MEKLYKQIGDEVREYTLEEYEQHEKDIIELENIAQQESQAAAEAATKRQALLDKLGITEEEAKLLLS